jgi:hypothetical protein
MADQTRQPVNLSFIDVLFDPVAGLADDDEAMRRYRSLDPDDEAAIRAVMRELLVPYVSTWTEPARAMARLGLAYGLSFRRDVLADRFYSMLPPFGLPDPPDRFFEWLWDELFGPDSWRLSDPDRYRVVWDSAATHARLG